MACQWESPGLGQLFVLGVLLCMAGGCVYFLASPVRRRRSGDEV